MDGKLSLVIAEQTADGQVLGTFDYERPDLETLRFQEKIPGNSTAGEVTTLLLQRVGIIAAAEPVPALAIVNKLFADGPRTISVPPAAK